MKARALRQGHLARERREKEIAHCGVYAFDCHKMYTMLWWRARKDGAATEIESAGRGMGNTQIARVRENPDGKLPC